MTWSGPQDSGIVPKQGGILDGPQEPKKALETLEWFLRF